ncbi:MAG: response regulator [Thermomicrobia bacterium]|nr:response regulator [Thermomicrobia bacterium]
MPLPVVAIGEDDCTTREFMIECLTVEGYRTLAYPRGAGAYEFIEFERPDAVILDIRMEHPRAGLAVLQRLRRDPETVDIPVLVCTADAPFIREWSRTLADGRCAVVTKPFDVAELLATIRHLLVSRAGEAPGELPRTVRVKRDPLAPGIRPVVALVDIDGNGLTDHTEQLERKGYKVVGCRWGNGLYDMAVREQPDLLIVDIDDSRRWLLARIFRRLRHDPLTSAIPLIVNPQRDQNLYRTIEEHLGPAPSSHPPMQQARSRHS